MNIKFGTDGWRGLIARDFTFESVSRAAHGVARVLQHKNPQLKKIAVGYDRRFLSRSFAQTVASVYAEYGFQVLFAHSYMPTPTFSWCAKFEPGIAGANVITASHNPPEWNGFKFKETFGGSALPELTTAFEREIASVTSESGRVPAPEDFDTHVRNRKITIFNPLKPYTETLLRLVDTAAIEKAKFTVALDVMHGAASLHLANLLRQLGVKVEELHADDNPGFSGIAPEPIEKNLVELCQRVKDRQLNCGLATDGDADRLGAVDENGAYFSTQQILSVVYWHMLRNRKKKWSIARSVSTTRMVDLIAKRAGMNCIETPVGFKFIAENIVKGQAQIGGEESGGIGVVDHIPERDSFLTALLLLELMATTKKGLAQIYRDLCQEERPYFFTRLDLHLTSSQAENAMRKLKIQPPKEWEGRAVESLLRLDGFKFYMHDGSWLLIRPSGTEPIFRIYAEAESLQATEKLIAAGRRFIETDE